jgi:hypothetical protein
MFSTCSLDQLSMLNDLTLEIWVPNLRWIAAHRMHRKMPNCGSGQHWIRERGSAGIEFDAETEMWDVHSMMPKLHRIQRVSSSRDEGGVEDEVSQLRTGIAGLTIGTKVVAGHADHEVLQRLLVARLLALAYRPRHCLLANELVQCDDSGAGCRSSRHGHAAQTVAYSRPRADPAWRFDTSGTQEFPLLEGVGGSGVMW